MGIHSTYSDNLLMLTLGRGGPVVWLSEEDARELGVEDNDWVEAFNSNGALTAKAIVSQRIPDGMIMMYHAQERLINYQALKLRLNVAEFIILSRVFARNLRI